MSFGTRHDVGPRPQRKDPLGTRARPDSDLQSLASQAANGVYKGLHNG